MRWTMLGTLAVLAVALGLAACGGSETDADTASPPPSPVMTQEPAASEATGATTQPEATTEATEPDTATQTTAPEAAGASLRVEVRDGQPVGGVEELTVTSGDDVTIEVSVDAPQEIHVHGYDLEAEATPDAPAVIELTADLEGVFDVESHTTEALLARLVVEP